MTDQIYDDRASAYVGARERLKAAESLKVDEKNRAVAQLPEQYWALLAEAAILADLAKADPQVGLMAGGYFVDQKRRIERNKRRFAGLTKTRTAGPSPAESGFTLGQRVMILHGSNTGRYGHIVSKHDDGTRADVELDPPGSFEIVCVHVSSVERVGPDEGADLP